MPFQGDLLWLMGEFNNEEHNTKNKQILDMLPFNYKKYL